MSKQIFSMHKKNHRQSFDVLVVATMSAGKSTLVNALIGHELLHAANEATTACHIRIAHRHDAKYFTGHSYSYEKKLLNRQHNISATQLRDWNVCPKVRSVSLFGKFASHRELVPNLVLHDTPGPNNSQDEKHGQLTFEAIRNIPFKILIYVLNASQLGTQDDRKLLEKLRKETARKRNRTFCFVLNKVDLLDSEKGEELSDYIASARSYLIEIGFKNPVIIPCVASVALYARKALAGEPLTRVQSRVLQQALEDLPIRKNTLLESAELPINIRNRVRQGMKQLEKAYDACGSNQFTISENQFNQLIISSGLGALETFIKHQQR